MIKFLDLKSINESYKNRFSEVFDTFLDSGTYMLGQQVEGFEKEFSQYCNTKYCIGVSNGLDALCLIFEAYKKLGKLKEGDEVIVPANTYIATVLAVSRAGLIPVFVDPNYNTFNIDIHKIEAAIGQRTKAILGVHLYGQLFNVEVLERLCKEHDLLLLEDAAQAHGAVYRDGRKAGNVSNVAAFSFYPTKNLGALGDAGAITTNNRELAEIIFKLRNYGRETSYINSFRGYNCRLDELQAAFLRVKLNYLDQDNKQRQQIARRYISEISSELIELPVCENLEEHVFHLFVIKTRSRDDFKDYLLRNNIESSIHYPVPVHQQKAYAGSNHLSYPITEKICDEVLSIPVNQLLREKEVDSVIQVISNYKTI
ncbi:MAG: DegT/DnrJ/EryC1/StrS family aminotransferase [Winogradskyella sp.]|uniref:DegT/DnrJ/EryC1/StrS family aminotransferase n=1 Tax=Winogradskyella sp. TaxID=1883156 RepID=UPI0017B77B30|nr:DegT/DnrJ/EryC1/StrS family aminotransferase [Winogradskyella sp.]MBT8245464.1 DegT/DnrJ/EryC1/StrS family aminotransferase [Winogradskyella sp.]NNK22311.1 DegT/DnrJ/EryC1/StrS family aminotransferase [Winogradskyella sp.]